MVFIFIYLGVGSTHLLLAMTDGWIRREMFRSSPWLGVLCCILFVFLWPMILID